MKRISARVVVSAGPKNREPIALPKRLLGKARDSKYMHGKSIRETLEKATPKQLFDQLEFYNTKKDGINRITAGALEKLLRNVTYDFPHKLLTPYFRERVIETILEANNDLVAGKKQLKF